jgi:hypothetical protein
MYTFCSGQAVAGALPEAGATPAGERISARRLVGLLEAVLTLGIRSRGGAASERGGERRRALGRRTGRGGTGSRWSAASGPIASDAHTFGTRMIREADIRRVQERMGHADIQTTMTYLHYESRKEDAQLVARAFASTAIESIPTHLLRASNRGSSRSTP